MDIFKTSRREAVIVRIYRRTFNPQTHILVNRRIVRLEPCWKKTTKTTFLGRLFPSKVEPEKVEYISVKTGKIITAPGLGYALEESPCLPGSCFVYPGGKRLVYHNGTFAFCQKGNFIPCAEHCSHSKEPKTYAVLL